eukprot:g62127.t1
MAQAEEIRTETGPLDYDYTEKEVELCQENLQNHKACSPDKIKNEMLKSRLRSSPSPSPESPELIARSFPTAPAVLCRLSQQQQQRRPARPAPRPPQAPPPSAPSAPAPAPASSSSPPVATGLAASLRLAKPSAALSAFFSSTRSSGSSSPLAAAPLPPAASLLSHTLGPSLPASLAHPRRSSWRPTPYRQALQKGDKAWVPDEHTLSCLLCKKPFTLLFRRHHCRCCGKLVCEASPLS